MARKHIHIGLYSTHVRKKLVAIFQAYIYLWNFYQVVFVLLPLAEVSCTAAHVQKPSVTNLYVPSHALITQTHAFTNLHMPAFTNMPSQTFMCLHKASHAFTNLHMHSQTFTCIPKPLQALTNLHVPSQTLYHDCLNGPIRSLNSR